MVAGLGADRSDPWIVIIDAATGTQVDEFGVDGASVGQAVWR